MKKATIISVFAISAILLLLFTGIQLYTNHRVSKELRTWLDENKMASAKFDTVHVNLFNQKAEINNVSIPVEEKTTRGTFHVKRIVVHEYDTENSPPGKLHISWNGITADENKELPTDSLLHIINKNKAEGNAEMKLRFSPTEKTFEIEQFSMKFPGLASVELEANFANISEETFDCEPEKLMFLTPTPLFKNAKIILKNETLAEKLLQSASPKAAEQMRKMILTKLAEQENKAALPEHKNVFKTIGEFVQSPGTLTVTSTPSEPIPPASFALWMYPAFAVGSFNISAEFIPEQPSNNH